MVAVSYPGIYPLELPSGVRTITGVGTSIALFIGRTRRGPVGKPVRCLSIDDFDRTFSLQYAGSDLARSVKLFFMNGGTECFVIREGNFAGLANGGVAAISLGTEDAAPVPTLRVEALSPGPEGNDIRARVDYNTTSPEATFNLEAFRWERTAAGAVLKRDAELHPSLSMDPHNPRYAVDVVNSASQLVKLTDLNAGGPGANGYSQGARAISARTNATFRDECAALFGAAAVAAGGNRFRISVDGNPFVLIDLSLIDVAAMAPATVAATLGAAIKGAIEAADPTITVNVTFEAGPVGQAAGGGVGNVPGVRNAATRYIRIASAKATNDGDVRIEAAPQADLARVLMLGPAFGGIERSAFAALRPAANGVFLQLGANLANHVAFGTLRQDAIDALRITTPGVGVEKIDLIGSSTLSTLDPAIVPPADVAPGNARMFQDRATSYAAIPPDPQTDGIREKYAIIAAAIASARAKNPNFPWNAEVWGNRIALVPAAGGDNLTATVEALKGAAVVAGALGFAQSARYYSLGTTGTGAYQSAGVAGAAGGAPGQADYDAAFKVVDREIDLFNLMILPRDDGHSAADTRAAWGPASVFCAQRRAMMLMDPPADWKDHNDAVDLTKGVDTLRVGLVKDHSALFFPNLTLVEDGKQIQVGPSGAVAGVMARIDATRGVWKAPAGTEADLRGIVGVQRRFSDGENGVMNPKAVNAIRVFPSGIVVWGARTMDGDDAFGSENKYIPIRRTGNFILLSLTRGLGWVVFQPNDEPLWSQVRLNVGAFMHDLFRQGAFQGATPRDAYFVRCDSSTTTQNDRNLGIVNIIVGFAPLKPAEFVVLYLQQMAGQIEV